MKISTQVDLFTNVEPTSVSPAIAKPMLAAVFLSLVFSTLENNLKISLKKFA
jgi:hypothetical protein